jgi:hypothetical protein
MVLSRIVLNMTKPSRTDHAVSWEEYARAIHLVLNGFGKGIDVDFLSRNLVGVGHSMGASGLSVLAFPFCVVQSVDPSSVTLVF